MVIRITGFVFSDGNVYLVLREFLIKDYRFLMITSHPTVASYTHQQHWSLLPFITIAIRHYCHSSPLPFITSHYCHRHYCHLTTANLIRNFSCLHH
eukprot:Awhi_evm2s14616